MDKNTAMRDLVLRDQAGIFYLLTPKVLAAIKASPETQAELRKRMSDDTHGFAQFVTDLRGPVIPTLLGDSANLVHRPRPTDVADAPGTNSLRVGTVRR